MTSEVCHLVVGPRRHGVVEYALSVHEALRGIGADHRLAMVAMPSAEMPAPDSALVHIHVTDRLFGRSPAEATANFLSVVGSLDCRVSVTLHDLPQPSDGSSLYARTAFYRTVVKVAVGVIVSSEHEAALLREGVDASVVPEVVPLMIVARRRRRRLSTPSAPTVGVLGFLYPGKGHLETLRAMQELPKSVGFLALGMPSAGHEYLAEELIEIAEGHGRSCEITGFLDEVELGSRIDEVTVPVAYHRHMSASGSINTWIGEGRRPLVPRGDYVHELDSRSAGVVSMHGDDDASLRHAIVAALKDWTTTWIDPAVEPTPTPSDVAVAYDRHLSRWAR